MGFPAQDDPVQNNPQQAALPPQFLRMFIRHQQILPLIKQFPAGRFFNHGQQTTECRFTAAGLPDHRKGLSPVQIKGYAVEGFHHPFR